MLVLPMPDNTTSLEMIVWDANWRAKLKVIYADALLAALDGGAQ